MIEVVYEVQAPTGDLWQWWCRAQWLNNQYSPETLFTGLTWNIAQNLGFGYREAFL